MNSSIAFVIIFMAASLATIQADKCGGIKCYLNRNSTFGTLNCSQSYEALDNFIYKEVNCLISSFSNKIILNMEKKEDRIFAHSISPGAIQRLFKSQKPLMNYIGKLSISFIYIKKLGADDFNGLNLDYLSMWSPETVDPDFLMGAVNKKKFTMKLFCESNNPYISISELYIPSISWRIEFSYCKRVKYQCYRIECDRKLLKYHLKLQNHDDAINPGDPGIVPINSDQCHQVEQCPMKKSFNVTKGSEGYSTAMPNKSFTTTNATTAVLSKSGSSLTMTLVTLTVLNVFLLTVVFGIIICLCVRHRRYRHHTFYIESSTNSKVQLIDKTPIVPRKNDTLESYCT